MYETFSAMKERLDISFFKYHCALQEEGTFVIVYEKFSKDFSDKSFRCHKNVSAVFPFRFLFYN